MSINKCPICGIRMKVSPDEKRPDVLIHESVKKLSKENERLRKALEFYMFSSDGGTRACQALEGFRENLDIPDGMKYHKDPDADGGNE